MGRSLVAGALFVGVMITLRAAPADEAPRASCGEPGQAPCPLQGWMRSRLAAALAARDFVALEQAFVGLGVSAPDPTWTEWSLSAQAGVTAAKAKDAKAVRDACKRCHDAHREDYRKRFRESPPPP